MLLIIDLITAGPMAGPLPPQLELELELEPQRLLPLARLASCGQYYTCVYDCILYGCEAN